MPATLESARKLLKSLGFDRVRCNDRSAWTLLALLGLTPGEPWIHATNDAKTVNRLIDEIASNWGKSYAVGSRESVRKFTLHQFVAAGLVEYNHDNPSRAVNDKFNNYRVSPSAITIIHAYETGEFQALLDEYLVLLPGQLAAREAAREMHRLPVTMPAGDTVTLSPGGQNFLLVRMVEEFCSRFAPGGIVLYLGDADEKYAFYHPDLLAGLGVVIDDPHGKMPDLVVYLPSKNWLFLMEAVTTHGPIDGPRRDALGALFADSTAGLVYVNCFPDRATMRRYLAELAWETEAWVADNPDHMIHFNGDRFLGPHVAP
ncbi:BsuBI/PstI family type II restriction endonuclease [Isoptericola sp. NPDC057653]|uniref:BsuBI/PstI family type II restriction endonuclease n=1 Tax=Isoptericola sp. NPDC057653 TaxID=3346195 RepID=UPI00369BE62E